MPDALEPSADADVRVIECSSCGNSVTPTPKGACPNCHRFLSFNTYALRHGGRRSLHRPEALAAMNQERDQLLQFHFNGDYSVIEADLASDYGNISVLIDSVVENLKVAGIFTNGGRTRAATNLLMALMDRRLRLAQTLGIERKVKQIDPLDVVRDAVAQANQK
jgi:hypothetical protein